MEKERTPYKKTPLYKVELNLRALPGAEEMVVEGDDGERKEGVFIPYEMNGTRLVYRGEKMAVLNIATIANSQRKRNTVPFTPRDLYSLHPYWTQLQRERMAEIGLTREDLFLGKMTIIGYCGWDFLREAEMMGGTE